MLLIFVAGLAGTAVTSASISLTTWKPIFQGIDRAAGTNTPDAVIPRLQVANCVRVDLTHPGVRLFPSPRAPSYAPGSVETRAFTITNFMRMHGLQVVTPCNYFFPSSPGSEGASSGVKGLLMTTGQVVSAVSSDERYSTLFFRPDKTPFFNFNNAPPGASTSGIHTAVTGYYAVLSNGVNIGASTIEAYPDGTAHDPQARTVFGISRDKRYLFLLVIDGAQPNYSEGATDEETASWLQHFGAWDGINMEGGASAAMYMADCSGKPVPLGRSSYAEANNRERIIGAQFGVYALPLPEYASDIVAAAAGTTATVTWHSQTHATSQVEYGPTKALGRWSEFDATPVTNHVVLLTGLSPGTEYFFRVHSGVGANRYPAPCAPLEFTTAEVPAASLIDLNSPWRFSSDNLDDVDWTSPDYDDSGWGRGNAPLWADSRVPIPSTSTSNIPHFVVGTRMPIDLRSGFPFTTYYFRTPVVLSNGRPTALIFSNYLDDAAVFYLNGVEVFRTNMVSAPIPVRNNSNAVSFTCSDATCPIVFTIAGKQLDALVPGTNVLSVELHNYRGGVNPSPDATFAQALFAAVDPQVTPMIHDVVVTPVFGRATITWQTREDAASEVRHGPTPAFGRTSTLDSWLSRYHAVSLTGLENNTTHHYRIFAVAGGEIFSLDGTFRTPDAALHITRSNGVVCLSWTGSTRVLQQSPALGSSARWTDVAAALGRTAYCLPAAAARGFFRLRE